ncbi:MAG TPA: hypothetical protein VFY10_10070, partial [Dehalococcoidia bacterium]|nr:hypothetical protein [Dehalococcoidia bacterium]
MRRYLTLGLFIALAVNLFIAVLYVWSRGGQTTVVEIESIAGRYRAIVDDTPVVGGAFDAPQSGSIRLIPPTPLRSFPTPSGIDSVDVLDPNGQVLFHDDFHSLDLGRWQVESGSFKVVDGVLEPLSATQDNAIRLRGPGWTSYTVRVKYRNNRGGVIGTHVTDSGGVFYHFELFRDFPNFFDVIKNNERTEPDLEAGPFIHTSEMHTLRSIAAMVTTPYPYVLVLLGAGLVLTMLLSSLEPRLAPRLALRRPRWRFTALLAVLGIAAVAAAITLALEIHYYNRIPHV